VPEVLRAIVRQYVETIRDVWKGQTGRAHADAVAAAEAARREVQLAEAKQQEFLDQFLADQQKASRPIPAPTTTPAQPAQGRVENPEWSRLNQQRAWLQRRRMEMLVDRTSAHPEVQELEHKLAVVQRELSGVTQWPATDTAGVSSGAGAAERLPANLPVTVGETQIDPQRVAREHAEARRHIDSLKWEAEQARNRCEQLAAAERTAWLAHVTNPEVDVAFSLPVEATARDLTADHILSTSLLAGMAMMVGVGMFAAGAAMEPTLDSAKQVCGVLGAPVVATVTLPGLRPATSSRYRRLLRTASCLGGVVLIAGCLGLLYRTIAG
jgi:hypothetical protein